VGYTREKTREELKKPRPEKKKVREDKRKKKKLADLKGNSADRLDFRSARYEHFQNTENPIYL
jgi:hypothetical protein